MCEPGNLTDPYMVAVKKEISGNAVIVRCVLDNISNIFCIYKTRWHVTYASCCSLIFETSSLVFVIANDGKVSLNAGCPLGVW